jgi:glycerol-3-phosphate dehydrogenase
VERGDFGGQTSWNSLRIIHGGFRYLQSLSLGRLYDSVRDRRWFLRCFPDLVRPLPCLMPLYGHGLRRASVLRGALGLNDWLTRHRNDGVGEASRLPAGGVLGADEVVRLYPDVPQPGLHGGALWYDGSADNAPRLLMEMVRWACHSGAVCLNYVEATGLVTHAAESGSRQRVAGVRVLDRAQARELEIRTPLVINALALNLLLDRDPLARVTVAVSSAGRSAEGGTYFLRPWKGGVMAGTGYLPRAPGQSGLPSDAEVRDLLQELNLAAPALQAGPSDIRRVYAGVLPARAAESSRPASRDRIIDHGRHGGPTGLWSIAGIKYTTAPTVAARLLDRVSEVGRGRSTGSCSGRPEPAGRHMEWSDFRALEVSDPEAASRILQRLQDQEAVLFAEDLVLRRTDWANDPAFDPQVVTRVAKTLGIRTAFAEETPS